MDSLLPGKYKVKIVDPDDNTREGLFDPIFKVPAYNSIGHLEVHEQDAFLCCHQDTSMSDTDTIVMAFKTPPGTKRMHLVYSFSTLAGGHLEIFKDSTWDAETGTLAPICNRFQLDTPASSAVLENQAQAGFVASDNMIADPTNLTHGTAVIPVVYAFGNKQISGGSSRDIEEIVLEPDTLHTILFTADGNTNAGQIYLNWYEHTDS